MKNMEAIKKYVSMAMLLTLFIGFSSCQDDETIYDRIVGRTWSGDLGFVDRRGTPLISYIKISSDGSGVDQQWYYDVDKIAGEVYFHWWIKDGNLFLDYGEEFSLLILEAVYVEGEYMTGVLYDGDENFGTVTLEMVD